MKDDTVQKAVQKALEGDWEETIKINKSILKKEPKDTEALNRLARAYAETGNYKKAKDTSKKVLKLDPFNSIAQKALDKWKRLKKRETKKKTPTSPEAFLEEPGKTKIVSLLHIGSKNTLAGLDAGDKLKLSPHKHRVSVTTPDGKYVGRLADDLSARLKKLIKYGNKYQVLIKSVELKKVKVFIRETKRSPKLSDTPSFSTEKINYISFIPPELVHKKDFKIPQDEDE